MDSGAEVLRVVAAIVSAFHTAADILEQIKDRKDKKKRKRERDVEELLELRILLRSLLEGETSCRRHCENRQQQFSPAFENGDAIAIPALKDVVIALQTEVIQALHIARAVDNAVLNFETLLESSITSRKDTTRVIDSLCKRITASAQFQPQSGGSVVAPSDAVSMLSFSTGIQAADYDKSYEIAHQTPAALSGIGNPSSAIYQRALPPLPQRTATVRRPSDTISQHSRYRHSQVPPQQPHPSPSYWPPKHIVGQLSPSHDFAPVSGPSSVADEEVSNHYTIDDQQIERMSITSIQESEFALASERGIRTIQPARNTSVASRLHHTPSVSDMTSSDQSRQSSQRDQDTSDQSPRPLQGEQSQEDPPKEEPVPQHFEIISENLPHVPSSQSPEHNLRVAQEHASVVQPAQQNFEIYSGQTEVHQPPQQNFEIYTEQSPVMLSPQAAFTVRTEQHSRDEVITVHLTPGRQRPLQSRVSSEGLRQQHNHSQVTPRYQQRSMTAPIACALPSQYEAEPQPRRCDVPAITTDIRTITPLHISRNPRYPDDRPLTSATISKPSDVYRTLGAPEVLPNDFEFSEKIAETKAEENEKYPAFLQQADYAERLESLKPGQESVWLPLARPAMHNRYHGFCKGAWQIRRNVATGLDVHVSENLRDPILHWQCKTCNFRSRAPNADALPDQILSNPKYGVKYRWLFLAKSHRSADVSSDSTDLYKYGCILCAAQGQTTAAYERLEHLMLHLVSKHKATMLTPEVRAKTKCIVGGGTADPEGDWDIQLPVASQKSGAGVAADELFVSASKFFGRRKKKG